MILRKPTPGSPLKPQLEASRHLPKSRSPYLLRKTNLSRGSSPAAVVVVAQGSNNKRQIKELAAICAASNGACRLQACLTMAHSFPSLRLPIALLGLLTRRRYYLLTTPLLGIWLLQTLERGSPT